MKQPKAFVLMALTIFSCLTACASPAPSLAKTAPEPIVSKEFYSFWERFKDALRKNDKNALADMTKLPYLDDEKKLNKAQFIARSETIFSAATRKCLVRQKPVPDQNSIFFFCDDSIYIFAKDQGKYKFIEIGVND